MCCSILVAFGDALNMFYDKLFTFHGTSLFETSEIEKNVDIGSCIFLIFFFFIELQSRKPYLLIVLYNHYCFFVFFYL